jgi:ABC-2 type transport system permease protein
MLRQSTTIARNTFVEAVRQPVYLLLILACGVGIFFTTWTAAFSMSYSDSAEVSRDDKLLLDVGLATVFVCAMLLAAFIATAVISREIENKTALTVVSKPVSRPAVVLGKYLGVAAAMLVAVGIMLIWLMLGIRHGAMTTAMDEPDQPVILFTFSALLLSLGAGIWCNFFYGWSFPQTTTMLLFPLTFLAYILVLLVSEKWKFQPIATDFKPQITLAGLCVLMSAMVMTAVATAASTRLGQVMTIVVCSGVFMLGLLSNHLVGRRAYSNTFVSRVESAAALRPQDEGFAEPGATYTVTLKTEPRTRLSPGDPFYYSASPSGFPMLTSYFDPPDKRWSTLEAAFEASMPQALVITQVQGRTLTVRRVGALSGPNPVDRAPEPGDYAFNKWTDVNPWALAGWGIIPNVQSFWLVDAVTQNQKIPLNHVAKLAVYALVEITGFLALAVFLFQKREVG